jgi:hypothetical protein
MIEILDYYHLVKLKKDLNLVHQERKKKRGKRRKG